MNRGLKKLQEKVKKQQEKVEEKVSNILCHTQHNVVMVLMS